MKVDLARYFAGARGYSQIFQRRCGKGLALVIYDENQQMNRYFMKIFSIQKIVAENR
jgi:hypothetical protein